MGIEHSPETQPIEANKENQQAPPEGATASFTFAEIKDFMTKEMKTAVREAVGGVANQVAGNMKDIKDIKEAITELRTAIAPGQARNALQNGPQTGVQSVD